MQWPGEGGSNLLVCPHSAHNLHILLHRCYLCDVINLCGVGGVGGVGGVWCAHVHKHTYTYTHVLTFLSLSQWGFTALLRAAYYGHAELVRMLLQEFGCSLDEVENVSVPSSVQYYP